MYLSDCKAIIYEGLRCLIFDWGFYLYLIYMYIYRQEFCDKLKRSNEYHTKKRLKKIVIIYW